ncbi:MAG: pectic acid lyase [Planctomycetaceae bacterium]|nr:pectic acid lyase [Planctomycetaceae bacterium]
MRTNRRRAIVVLMFAILPGLASAGDPTADEAASALRKAVTFFRDKVSVEGTYVWRYSDDLTLCEGEAKATRTTAWVQSPGTPAVGEALLAAYERTKEQYLLDAAVATAHGLVKGQLASGGWDYRIEFDPADRKRYAYRTDGQAGDKPRNVTTLDDDNTQSALRFLMHMDRVLEQQDAKIHEAAMFALGGLLAAQYPNGAWPQRFSAPPKAEDFPVMKASYPDSWPKTWPNVNYTSYYTLNDNAQATTISTLFEAAEIYGDKRYADAARRGGDFLILAQMPDPQPAWAQQYDAQMHPAWARKFEPPSITGGESQGAIRILMDVYRQTGDKKYLEPIPRALDYLEKSALAGGRLARFNELKTNKPLYFTKQYELVYTDGDLPTHYAFTIANNIPKLRRDYERLVATDPARLKPALQPAKYAMSPELARSARQAIDALDAAGAWIEDGRLRDADPDRNVRRIITTTTFIRNVDTLSRFLAAT